MGQLLQTSNDCRVESRQLAVFKIAMIKTTTRDGLCLIRNLSAGGAKIETLRPLAVGERISLLWRSDRTMHCSVRWSADTFAGLQFDDRLDPAELLACEAKAPGQRTRAPRFAVDAAAMIWVGGRQHAARLVNLSLGGAAIRLTGVGELETGARCDLEIAHLGRLPARLCWQNGANAGLRFCFPLEFRALAKWLEHELSCEVGTPFPALSRPVASQPDPASAIPTDAAKSHRKRFGHRSLLPSALQRHATASAHQTARACGDALDRVAMVAIVDTRGRIVSVNSRFCEISGYSEAELIGADYHLFRSDEHAPAFFRKLYRTAGRGMVWRGEICDRAKCGRLYWTHTTVVPHLGSNDRSMSYAVIRFAM